MDLKLKRVINKLPEIVFFMLLFVYWFSTTLLNPIVIVLMAILLLKMFKNNKIIDITISVIFFIASFYFLFALMSEFSEFETLKGKSLNLLYVGASIFLVIFISSITMFIQSLKKHKLI